MIFENRSLEVGVTLLPHGSTAQLQASFPYDSGNTAKSSALEFIYFTITAASSKDASSVHNCSQGTMKSFCFFCVGVSLSRQLRNYLNVGSLQEIRT